MEHETPLMHDPKRGALFLGLDMGGTHTDAVLVAVKDKDDGVLSFSLVAAIKTPTRHDDLLGSAEQALSQLLHNVPAPMRAAVCRVSLGTTLGVNAVVRKTYDPVGLALAAGPGREPALAGLGEHTVIIGGGLDHRGAETVPLDLAAMTGAARRWQKQGIRAMACVGKFSPRNPVHEQAMARAVNAVFLQDISAEQASFSISMGHRLSGQLNFPRRVATTYWNAAVWRLHNAFADAMEGALARCGITAPVYLLKADGGAVPLAASRAFPVEALLSGPAASVMGVLACLAQNSVQARQDALVLDMGGTTTDIAVLAGGVPVLSAQGLMLEGRSTLVRSLKSISLGLGGDSLLQLRCTASGLSVTVGPKRVGPAMAFGGKAPTFLDALNVLGYARAGDVDASLTGLKALAGLDGLTAKEVASVAVETSLQHVLEAVTTLLREVNSRPVYTLAALMAGEQVAPQRVFLVGGPAKVMAPLLEQSLGLPVELMDAPSATLGNAAPGAQSTDGASLSPPLGAVANAVGAALTRPTAGLEVFADTRRGVLLAPSLGVEQRLERRSTLEQVKTIACTLLRNWAVEKGMAPRAGSKGLSVDVLEAQSFATLDESGHGGRDMRVRCQLRPGIL